MPGDAERFRLIPSTPREWTFAGLLALALAALVGFAVYTATRPDTTTAKAPAPSGATEPADPSAAATPPAPAPSTPPSVPSVASLTQPLKDCVERVGSWGFDLNDSTVRADAIAGCKLPR